MQEAFAKGAFPLVGSVGYASGNFCAWNTRAVDAQELTF
jgi:hypothetical protein